MTDTATVMKDTTANPAPLGLLGFGMTTVLLNLHNAGLFPMNSMILGMGLFYGGFAQLLAGFMEWKKGNTFGTTAFISYGFFWLSLVTLLLLPKLNLATAPDTLSMSAYLGIWGILTFFLFLASMKLNRITQVVFGSLTLLFFLLSYGNFSGNAEVLVIAGYEGIFCGLCAMYAAIAQVTNEMYGSTILPLGIKSSKK